MRISNTHEHFLICKAFYMHKHIYNTQYTHTHVQQNMWNVEKRLWPTKRRSCCDCDNQTNKKWMFITIEMDLWSVFHKQIVQLINSKQTYIYNTSYKCYHTIYMQIRLAKMNSSYFFEFHFIIFSVVSFFKRMAVLFSCHCFSFF